MTLTAHETASSDATQPQPLQGSPRRPMWRTVQRHPVLLLGAFCLLCTIAFVGAPYLHRWYEVSGTVEVGAPDFAPLPELAALPQATLSDIAQSMPSKVTTRFLTKEGGTTKVLFTAGDARRDAAWVRIQEAADRFSSALRHRASETAVSYRSSLRKSSEQLEARETSLAKDIEVFRLSHRGALPDDPTSTISRYDKLVSKLEERQDRLKLVSEQIKRLQDFKRNGGASPPPPLPTANASATPGKGVESDPEVLALRAQLQLINDQLEEQLGKLRRTEQHPYVVDLRSQQAALQKKLDGAKERAAAGKPAPVDARTTLAGSENSAAAEQRIDLQLESLHAERDALDGEVRGLAGQRDLMQKQVEDVVPVRQEFEKLTQDLAAVRKDRDKVRGQLDDFSRQFKTAGEDLDKAIVVSPMAMSTASLMPAFPQLPVVYGAGILGALVLVWIFAWILHRADRSMHTEAEAASALGLPVVGEIPEICTGLRRVRVMLWGLIFRPLLVIAWVTLAIAAGYWCYQRLADPHFPDGLQSRGMATLFYIENHGG